MTKVKKVLGMMMAALLCFALTPAAAFATSGEPTTGDNPVETGPGTIKIENVKQGQAYMAYRILDLESHNGDAYSYKVAEKWKGFFVAPSNPNEFNPLNYVTVAENGYVTWKSDVAQDDAAAAAVFAQNALNWAKINKVAPTAQTGEDGAQTNPVVFNGLPLGYYLVDSSVGVLCSLGTTGGDDDTAVITEKNDAPTIDKQVQNSKGEYGYENDASIGDVVNFRTTISAKAGAQNYVIHDTMSAGLTFNAYEEIEQAGQMVSTPNASVSIQKKDAEGNVTSTKVYPQNSGNPGSDYVEYWNYTIEEAHDCTFAILFYDAFYAELEAGDDIIVDYHATLNENAVVDRVGNPNEVYLVYGDNVKTLPSKTVTYTWQMPIYKYTGNLDNPTPLPGAKFSLYKDGNLVKFSEKTIDDKTVYVFNGTDVAEGDLTEIETPADGYLYIQGINSSNGVANASNAGIDGAIYKLVEVEAPAGYNKMADMDNIKVNWVTRTATDEDGTITETYNTADFSYGPESARVQTDQVNVLNNAGTELPSTGGMGTTILYIVGAVLVIGAVVFLVRRRSSATK